MEDLEKDVLEVDKNEQEEKETATAKTYTQEELDKLLQAETDRKTTKALETAKEKWKAEYESQLEQEKSEAEKLAKMTEEEKWKAKLEQEKSEFEKQRQSFLKEKMELETVKQLSNQGLPVTFASYVMADEAEMVQANIKAFKDEWETAIEQAVNERLKGNTPKSSVTGTSVKTMSKAEFNALPYKERAQLLAKDTDLLQKLK